MCFPGQRVQVDVKFVPASCIFGAAEGEKYYKYTAIATLKSMENIQEISISYSRNNGTTIVPLPKGNFVVVSTGEVKQMQHHALDRTENLRNLEKTMRNLSDLINTNITPGNAECCIFITFTYKENMQNSF